MNAAKLSRCESEQAGACAGECMSGCTRHLRSLAVVQSPPGLQRSSCTHTQIDRRVTHNANDIEFRDKLAVTKHKTTIDGEQPVHVGHAQHPSHTHYWSLPAVAKILPASPRFLLMPGNTMLWSTEISCSFWPCLCTASCERARTKQNRPKVSQRSHHLWNITTSFPLKQQQLRGLH